MRSRDPETRDRLLNAAARRFSARGFKRVTVRDLCRLARANVASVNYHFGSKLGLYREVLHEAVTTMRATLEAARAAGAGGGADMRLRAYVRVYLEWVAGSARAAWIHQLIARELMDPTPALDVIVQQAIRPRMQYLCAIVGELLGRPPDDARVTRCAHSIHVLCVSMMPNPLTARLYPDFKLTPRAVAALADHLYAFSLAGARSMRQQPGTSPAPGAHRRRSARAARGAASGGRSRRPRASAR